MGVSTTDADFTLNKQGGAKTVDVGRSTDLAAGVNFNDHAGVHVAWKDANVHAPVSIAIGSSKQIMNVWRKFLLSYGMSCCSTSTVKRMFLIHTHQRPSGSIRLPGASEIFI